MRLEGDEHQADPEDVLRFRVLEWSPGEVHHDDAAQPGKHREQLEQHPSIAARQGEGRGVGGRGREEGIEEGQGNVDGRCGGVEEERGGWEGGRVRSR